LAGVRTIRNARTWLSALLFNFGNGPFIGSGSFLRGSSDRPGGLRRTSAAATFNRMGEQNGDAPNRRYRWPWFVLAAVVLFVVLAMVWMSFAVHREKQERDFNAPLPAAR
jgi:hypothetical protein